MSYFFDISLYYVVEIEGCLVMVIVIFFPLILEQNTY